MKFGLLFIIVILSAATINSLILIIKGDKSFRDSTMLYASLFFYNFILLVYFTWFGAGYIVEVPHLLRTLSPLIYLGAPFFYFYIRNSIYNSTGFKNSDWVHFIPAVVHFLDLFPFYMESFDVKLAYAQALVSDPTRINHIANGLIPMSFHYLFRIILQTCYFVYAAYLVYRVQPHIYRSFNIRTPINWFLAILFFMGWMVLFQLIYAVIDIFNSLEIMDFQGLNYIIRRISLVGILMLNVFINFKPKSFLSNVIVEGKNPKRGNFIASKGDNFKTNQEKLFLEIDATGPNSLLKDEGIESVKRKIISLLEDEQIFKENGMNLPHFSNRLGLPLKSVSQEINSKFGIGFNELLNQYRVKFAIGKIEHGYLDDFTLEALGHLSGFNSRTTFFNAFKKKKGCSPSEFWKSYQSSLD